MRACYFRLVPELFSRCLCCEQLLEKHKLLPYYKEPPSFAIYLPSSLKSCGGFTPDLVQVYMGFSANFVCAFKYKHYYLVFFFLSFFYVKTHN